MYYLRHHSRFSLFHLKSITLFNVNGPRLCKLRNYSNSMSEKPEIWDYVWNNNVLPGQFNIKKLHFFMCGFIQWHKINAIFKLCLCKRLISRCICYIWRLQVYNCMYSFNIIRSDTKMWTQTQLVVLLYYFPWLKY